MPRTFSRLLIPLLFVVLSAVSGAADMSAGAFMWQHSVTLRYIARVERQAFPVLPTSFPLPNYPAELVRAGIEGFAVVRFTLREDYSIADVKISSSSQREFDKPAIEAVSRWTFEHAKEAPKDVKWSGGMLECRFEFKMPGL